MIRYLSGLAVLFGVATAHAQSYTCQFPEDDDAIVFVRTEQKAIFNFRSRISGEVSSIEMACGDNVCAIRQAGNIEEYDLSHHVIFNSELTEVVSSFVGLHVLDEKNIFDTNTYRIECE